MTGMMLVRHKEIIKTYRMALFLVIWAPFSPPSFLLCFVYFPGIFHSHNQTAAALPGHVTTLVNVYNITISVGAEISCSYFRCS